MPSGESHALLCLVCSRAARTGHGTLPIMLDTPNVRVERATIFRDVVTGEYKAIAHCHGDTEIVTLPIMMARLDESALATCFAFNK